MPPSFRARFKRRMMTRPSGFKMAKTYKPRMIRRRPVYRRGTVWRTPAYRPMLGQRSSFQSGAMGYARRAAHGYVKSYVSKRLGLNY